MTVFHSAASGRFADDAPGITCFALKPIYKRSADTASRLLISQCMGYTWSIVVCRLHGRHPQHIDHTAMGYDLLHGVHCGIKSTNHSILCTGTHIMIMKRGLCPYICLSELAHAHVSWHGGSVRDLHEHFCQLIYVGLRMHSRKFDDRSAMPIDSKPQIEGVTNAALHQAQCKM